MASIRYYINNQKSENSIASVYLYIGRSRSEYKRLKTPFSVYCGDWDRNSGRLKMKAIQRRVMQPKLDDLLQRAMDLFTEGAASDFNLLCENIKAEMEGGSFGMVLDRSVTQSIDHYLEVKGVYERTAKKFRTCRNYFQSCFGDGLSFENFTIQHLSKFKRYLFSHGLVNDTAAKYTSCLRQVMAWSYDEGAHGNTLFNSSKFKVKKSSGVSFVVLTQREFALLMRTSIPEKWEKVRDLFAFMVYTGQRWQDCQDFDLKNYDGNSWTYYPQKTKGSMKRVSIPMVGFCSGAKSIIEKYNGSPKLSQQYFNRELKQLCKHVGIDGYFESVRLVNDRPEMKVGRKWEFVSSHTARRSCVTILLAKGVPPSVVMKITGHTDLKMLQAYTHLQSEQVVNALEGT